MTPAKIFAALRVTFLMLQVCVKPITWYICYTLTGLKQTRGIKNVTLKSEGEKRQSRVLQPTEKGTVKLLHNRHLGDRGKWHCREVAIMGR